MTDPITRAKAAAERIEEHRAAMTAARQDRRAAIIEARETLSAVEIAAQLGITRARVYNIAAGRE